MTIDNIYILAPVKCVSGGPELAHQLCNVISEISDLNVKMCYVNPNENNMRNAFPIDESAASVYDEYKTSHATLFDEIDKANSLVVVPEALTPSIDVLNNSVIALWWMSVDNYILSTQEQNIDFLNKRVAYHLVQSKYAEEYVKNHFDTTHIYKLTDYINEMHGQFILPPEYRRNQILYNPAKGKECVDELIKMFPKYKFVPLCGLTIEEMVVLMQSSKLYIDFGNHPGKDRIPREAASNGCCVITNKKGSALYFEDVPIDDVYKIENPIEQNESFGSLVEDVFGNFEKHFTAFENYRKWIKGEKDRFILEVKNILDVILMEEL